MDYRNKIKRLICAHPLCIDTDVRVSGRAPYSASSEFLTNKEQGDWAEKLVIEAINSGSAEYVAVPYGKSDSIAAGDPGFAEFYGQYQEELNSIGKRPDILIYKKGLAPESFGVIDDVWVSRAVAAIEVRSSSFLANKYKSSMAARTLNAETRCEELRCRIMSSPYRELLKIKNPSIYSLLERASVRTYRDLGFRAVSWSSTKELRELSDLLKELKSNISILHKRDHLSITPKLEDIALVNRWIDCYNVPHFYLQVFFDRAYMISFEDILSISSDPEKEGSVFSVEGDVKNQGKTTIKIDIDAGLPVIQRIDMPQHHSAMKELERGRLLFFVKFDGGKGYMDLDVFNEAIKNA